MAATLNNLPETSTAEKVLQLSIELAETKDRKKASVKTYNEELTRIAAEIAALINDSKESTEADDN